MKIKKFKLVLLVLPLFLEGCAGMNDQFGCNTVQGLSTCTSMGTINQMANQGDFNQAQKVYVDGDKVVVSKGNTTPKLEEKDGESTPAVKGSSSAQTNSSNSPMPGEPIRFGETVQRIWISSWQDTAGNYHEPSYVDVITKSGHWIGNPPSITDSSNI